MSAVQSQVTWSAMAPFCFRAPGLDSSQFDEVLSIFDTGKTKGLAGDSFEKIPKIAITGNNNVDASGRESRFLSVPSVLPIGSANGFLGIALALHAEQICSILLCKFQLIH